MISHINPVVIFAIILFYSVQQSVWRKNVEVDHELNKGIAVNLDMKWVV